MKKFSLIRRPFESRARQRPRHAKRRSLASQQWAGQRPGDATATTCLDLLGSKVTSTFQTEAAVEIADRCPRKIVAAVMQPILACDVPPVLRPSIERERCNLIGLASSLLHMGMDNHQVGSVIGCALSSYHDELFSALQALTGQHET